MRLGRRSTPDDVAVERADAVAHLGVLSQPWRAVVRRDGSIDAPRGAPVRWAVVAEDRIHRPEASPTMRQRCVDGAPVVETALRVPGGDVVVTAFAVADAGGVLVLDVENRSGLSVAFATSRTDAVSARAFAAPPAGGDLPGDWGVLPLGHGSSTRLAVPASGPLAPGVVAALPDSAAVVRGWRAQLSGGLHGDLPGDVDERLARSRSHACLAPAPDVRRDAVGVLLRAGQLAACGLTHEIDAAEVAAAAERVASTARRAGTTPWDAAAAMVAAGTALDALREARARDDLRALAARLPAATPTPDDAPADDARYEAWLARRLAVADGASLRLLTTLPDAWLGVNLSAYDVPTAAGRVGFAIRWHGARPALLWEAPLGVTVSCPGLDPSWSSADPRGEALLEGRSPL